MRLGWCEYYYRFTHNPIESKQTIKDFQLISNIDHTYVVKYAKNLYNVYEMLFLNSLLHFTIPVLNETYLITYILNSKIM